MPHSEKTAPVTHEPAYAGAWKDKARIRRNQTPTLMITHHAPAKSLDSNIEMKEPTIATPNLAATASENITQFRPCAPEADINTATGPTVPAPSIDTPYTV